MSAFHTLQVSCPCGHKFDHTIARGINVQRKPEFRKQILDGTFHRVKCPECTQHRTIETAFSYADPERNLFIQVRPRKQFFNWKTASYILEQKVNRLPKHFQKTKSVLRVVYGLAELREKLLCQLAGLDDRMLEIMKVNLLYEHPFLMKKPRLQFVLSLAGKDGLEFRASHLHEKRHYQIIVPAEHLNRFKSQQRTIQAKLKPAIKSNNIFDPKHGHFMSYVRYMPQTDALELLVSYARDLRTDKKVDLDSPAFHQMMEKLPRGSHLSTQAKAHLKALQLYARQKKNEKVQAQLWEVRFGKELEPEFWKNSNTNDIGALWKLFEELPDNHIEGNNRIKEITLFSDETDDALGYYVGENDEIEISTEILSHRADFEDTIRHEVGHGVHAKQNAKVQKWLKERFGWESFELNKAGLDKWVKAMGGWGDASASEKSEVLRCFKEAFSKDDGTPGTVRRSAKHIWNRKGFRPRKAYDESPADWYANCNKYCKDSSKTKAFFLNYTYGTFYTVNVKTIEMINDMPSNYAAVSDSEFFAELYAFHFDQENPKRKKLPKDVRDWLDKL